MHTQSNTRKYAQKKQKNEMRKSILYNVQQYVWMNKSHLLGCFSQHLFQIFLLVAHRHLSDTQILKQILSHIIG